MGEEKKGEKMQDVSVLRKELRSVYVHRRQEIATEMRDMILRAVGGKCVFCDCEENLILSNNDMTAMKTKDGRLTSRLDFRGKYFVYLEYLENDDLMAICRQCWCQLKFSC